MYFCVYEHYDEIQPNYYEKKESKNIIECLVCLETKIVDELTPIKLKDQTLYFTRCKCNSYIHKKCLKMWIEKQSICPICRVNITDASIILLFSKKYIPYSVNIYLFIKSLDINIFKVLLVYLFLYIILDTYIVQEHYSARTLF